MAEWKVILEETISQEFVVEANSREEAENMAIEGYREGQFVLEDPCVIERGILIYQDDTAESDFVRF